MRKQYAKAIQLEEEQLLKREHLKALNGIPSPVHSPNILSWQKDNAASENR